MLSDPRPVVICYYFHYLPGNWVWLQFLCAVKIWGDLPYNSFLSYLKGCCRKQCGALYLIKSCSTTTPIYKSSLWWGLLAVGEPILRSGGGPLWWAARQCCYCTSQARGYDGSNNARQIPPQIPPISGRGAEPTHGEWKRVILEQFPLILLPLDRWKSFTCRDLVMLSVRQILPET